MQGLMVVLPTLLLLWRLPMLSAVLFLKDMMVVCCFALTMVVVLPL
jgi:hypothetical protein